MAINPTRGSASYNEWSTDGVTWEHIDYDEDGFSGLSITPTRTDEATGGSGVMGYRDTKHTEFTGSFDIDDGFKSRRMLGTLAGRLFFRQGLDGNAAGREYTIYQIIPDVTDTATGGGSESYSVSGPCAVRPITGTY